MKIFSMLLLCFDLYKDYMLLSFKLKWHFKKRFPFSLCFNDVVCLHWTQNNTSLGVTMKAIIRLPLNLMLVWYPFMAETKSAHIA